MTHHSLTYLFLVALLFGCGESDSWNDNQQSETVGRSSKSASLTSIEWRQQKIDFGKITEGQKLEVTYHFKNTGTMPLIIDKVEHGCGCTVAETPKEPIGPGKEGVIKGAFDSEGRIGTQHKSIFVTANTDGSKNHELVFTVEVLKK